MNKINKMKNKKIILKTLMIIIKFFFKIKILLIIKRRKIMRMTYIKINKIINKLIH